MVQSGDELLNLPPKNPLMRGKSHYHHIEYTYASARSVHCFVSLCMQPGKLLPSAHAVDREYRVMSAVGQHGVPIPPMLAFSDDNRWVPCLAFTVGLALIRNFTYSAHRTIGKVAAALLQQSGYFQGVNVLCNHSKDDIILLDTMNSGLKKKKCCVCCLVTHLKLYSVFKPK